MAFVNVFYYVKDVIPITINSKGGIYVTFCNHFVLARKWPNVKPEYTNIPLANAMSIVVNVVEYPSIAAANPAPNASKASAIPNKSASLGEIVPDLSMSNTVGLLII